MTNDHKKIADVYTKELFNKPTQLKNTSQPANIVENTHQNFLNLFAKYMSEELNESSHENSENTTAKKLQELSNKTISKINKDEQYIVTWKEPSKHNNQKTQHLKGESVKNWLDDISSIKRAFSKKP